MVAAINVKKNVTALFPNLNIGDTKKVVEKMLAAGSVGAIIEAYIENPVGFEYMMEKMDKSDTLDLQLIRSYYEVVSEFLGSSNPYEMAKEFPRTREQMLIKVVKFGLLKNFPETNEMLEDEITDTVPFIMNIFTETGDKCPKYKKLTQLINFGIDVTDKETGGRAFKPLEKFIEKLEVSYDDEKV